MDFEQARFNMVEQQIRPWDVLDFTLLDALSEIPREAFVNEAQKPYAYADTALPLPNGASMLEPKIVARLAQGLALKPNESVLEIGTGSGYATALLAKLARQVITIDTDPQQQTRAQSILNQLQLNNIHFQQGDGLTDTTPYAPYDAIYIGGALKGIPKNLKQQLRDGGRLVVIVGDAPVQRALLITRCGNSFSEKTLFDTFVSYLNSPADTPVSKFTF